MKFFFEDNIINSIVNRHNEPIFLFNKTSMSLSEIAVSLILHIKATSVIEPSVHSSLVIELHHLR